jgi:hypothetical protein
MGKPLTIATVNPTDLMKATDLKASTSSKECAPSNQEHTVDSLACVVKLKVRL